MSFWPYCCRNNQIYRWQINHSVAPAPSSDLQPRQFCGGFDGLASYPQVAGCPISSQIDYQAKWIAVDTQHAILEDGSLWTWGETAWAHARDQGISLDTTRVNGVGLTCGRSPVRVGSDTGWTAVSGQLAMKGTALYSFGSNKDGRLGIGLAPSPGDGEWNLGKTKLAGGFYHSVISSGVSSVKLFSTTTNYTSLPSLTVVARNPLDINGVDLPAESGAGAVLTPDWYGSVVSVSVTSGGTEYASAPTIAFSPAGKGDLSATATVTDGKLTKVTITGIDYSWQSIPTVEITGGGGKNAVAVCDKISGPMTGVTVTATGSGYSTTTGLAGQRLRRLYCVVNGQAAAGTIALQASGVTEIKGPATGRIYSPQINGKTYIRVEGLGVVGKISGITLPNAAGDIDSTGVGSVSVSTPAGVAPYTGTPTVQFWPKAATPGGSGACGTAIVENGVVTSVNVTSSGSGYAAAPDVFISGGGGPTWTAQNPLYGVVAIEVTSGGSYESVPTVTVYDFESLREYPDENDILTPAGDAPGMVPVGAYAVLTGYVNSLALTTSGSGYAASPLPTVTISPPPNGYETRTATATCLVQVKVQSVTVTNPGTRYAYAPTVVFSSGTAAATAVLSATGGVGGAEMSFPFSADGVVNGGPVTFSCGGGSGAAGTLVVSAGVITSITITSPGSGYTEEPAVGIPGYTGYYLWAVVAYLSRTVASITVTDGGTHYETPPTVTIVANDTQGVNATASVVVSGIVTSVGLTDPGAGYGRLSPVVTISPPPTGGVTATANAGTHTQGVSKVVVTSPGYYPRGVHTAIVEFTGGNGAMNGYSPPYVWPAQPIPPYVVPRADNMPAQTVSADGVMVSAVAIVKTGRFYSGGVCTTAVASLFGRTHIIGEAKLVGPGTRVESLTVSDSKRIISSSSVFTGYEYRPRIRAKTTTFGNPFTGVHSVQVFSDLITSSTGLLTFIHRGGLSNNRLGVSISGGGGGGCKAYVEQVEAFIGVIMVTGVVIYDEGIGYTSNPSVTFFADGPTLSLGPDGWERFTYNPYRTSLGFLSPVAPTGVGIAGIPQDMDAIVHPAMYGVAAFHQGSTLATGSVTNQSSVPTITYEAIDGTYKQYAGDQSDGYTAANYYGPFNLTRKVSGYQAYTGFTGVVYSEIPDELWTPPTIGDRLSFHFFREGAVAAYATVAATGGVFIDDSYWIGNTYFASLRTADTTIAGFGAPSAIERSGDGYVEEPVPIVMLNFYAWPTPITGSWSDAAGDTYSKPNHVFGGSFSFSGGQEGVIGESLAVNTDGKLHWWGTGAGNSLQTLSKPTPVGQGFGLVDPASASKVNFIDMHSRGVPDEPLYGTIRPNFSDAFDLTSGYTATVEWTNWPARSTYSDLHSDVQFCTGGGYYSAPSVEVIQMSDTGISSVSTVLRGPASFNKVFRGHARDGDNRWWRIGYSPVISPTLTRYYGSGTVASVTVSNVSAGQLTTGSPVEFFSLEGSGAAGYLNVADNQITGVTITNPGKKYSQPPTVTVTGYAGDVPMVTKAYLSGTPTTATFVSTESISATTVTYYHTGSSSTTDITLFQPDSSSFPAISTSGFGAGISVGPFDTAIERGGAVVRADATTDPLLAGLTSVKGNLARTSSGVLKTVPMSGLCSVHAGPIEIELTASGSGYTEPPLATIAGQSGGTATCTIDGQLVAVGVISGGSGYATPPAVTISGGGASATAVIEGPIASITITAGGTGYRNPPTATFSQPGLSPSGTCEVVNGAVTSYSFSEFKGLYRSAPTIAFTPVPDLDSVTVDNSGSGYLYPPTLAVVGGGGGSGAVAVAVMDYSVGTVALTSGGSGYSTAPTVSFSGAGGSGTGATATATVANGAVTGVTVLTKGTGFVPPISLTFTHATGGGARATVRQDGKVASVSVLQHGVNYYSLPTIVFTGGGGPDLVDAVVTPVLASPGTGASATCTIVGEIKFVQVTSPGSGYQYPPTATVATGGAVLQAKILGRVNSISTTSASNYYVTHPRRQDGYSDVSRNPSISGKRICSDFEVRGNLYRPQKYWSLRSNPPAFSSGTVSAVTGRLTYPTAGYDVSTGDGHSLAGSCSDAGVIDLLTPYLAGYSAYQFASPPTVLIAPPPPGGSQASASAVINAAGYVVGLQISASGSGYTSPPTVTVSGPSKYDYYYSNQFSAVVSPSLASSLFYDAPNLVFSDTYGVEVHASMTLVGVSGQQVGGRVGSDYTGTFFRRRTGRSFDTPASLTTYPELTSVTGRPTPDSNLQDILDDLPGGGDWFYYLQYSTLPTATIEDVSGTGRSCTVYGYGDYIDGFSFSGGNSNYTLGSRISLSGGEPLAWTNPATATATIVDGVVNSIWLDGSGAGYTVAPQVFLSGGGGTGATATATFSEEYGQVTDIVLTSGGSGYVTTPTVVIADGEVPFHLLLTPEGLSAADIVREYYRIRLQNVALEYASHRPHSQGPVADVSPIWNAPSLAPFPTMDEWRFFPHYVDGYADYLRLKFIRSYSTVRSPPPAGALVFPAGRSTTTAAGNVISVFWTDVYHDSAAAVRQP